jgi:DNA repair exonuclease SbcCD nuclease subunit
MIEKIAQIADCHLRKSTTRHQEYREVFNELYQNLKADKPDRIVIVGDLFHDYIKLEGEVLVLAAEFLRNLSLIAKVIIIRGNHDISKSTINRTDAIEALVTTMNDYNIVYYNKTGLYEDQNVVWAVWKHGEKKNNPYPKNFIKDPTKTYIDLFHDEVNGASNPDGYIFNDKSYRSITDFMGDYSFFGHLHKLQYL